MNTVTHFFNSSFFIALVTIFVGLVALYIYWRQHHDEKTDGAKLIYSEIVGAENKLKSIKQKFFASEHPLLENIILMPYESWSRYKYLFKSNLDDSEWELIEGFYNHCLSYDAAVRLNDSYFHQNAIPYFDTFTKHYQGIVNEFIKGSPNKIEFTKKEQKNAKHFQDVFLQNSGYIWYQPQKPVNDARAALVAMDSNVSLSSSGQKIKKISKLKS